MIPQTMIDQTKLTLDRIFNSDDFKLKSFGPARWLDDAAGYTTLEPSADDEKIKEIIHTDFHDITPISPQLTGYNACYFCLGVSSVGMDEEKYTNLTYHLTMHVAGELLKLNPDMTMIYVSGAGTDSSEKGRSMWARVKGKTENEILGLGFKDAYAFRPGFIVPTKGLKNTLKPYKYLGFLTPLIRTLFPKYVTTLREIGIAMISVTIDPIEKKILECPDIVAVAKNSK